MPRISFLFCFLLVFFISPLMMIKSSDSPAELLHTSVPLPPFIGSSLSTDTASIIIDDNTDFHTQALTYNWPGDGSPTSPYIISNKDVPEGRIIISNTDLYFLITNLSRQEHWWYTEPSEFITLTNTSNGKIVDNILSGGEVIKLENSHDILLRNNSGVAVLIELRDSSANLIQNNSCEISLYSSHNNSILNSIGRVRLFESQDNYLFNISNSEIYLDRSGNNSLVNNSVRFSFTGSLLSHFKQGLIANNTLNGQPILFWEDKVGGSLSDGDKFGQVFLVNCSSINCSFQQPKVEENTMFYFCSDILVYNTNLSHEYVSEGDIGFVHTTNSQVVTSTIRRVRLVACSNVFLTNNSISSIDLIRCERINVSDNRLDGGIGMYDCTDLLVSGNVFSSGNGMFLDNTNKCTILGNSNVSGLLLNSGRDHRIINNSFHDLGFRLLFQGYIYTGINPQLFQREVSGNTLNGEPIIFWQNVTGGTIPSNVNQVFLLNCRNVVIRGQELVDQVLLASCTNLTVQGNSLFLSTLLLIETNTSDILDNSIYGEIFSIRSHNNNFTHNSVNGSAEGFISGIACHFSNQNTFIQNTLVKSWFELGGDENRLINNQVIGASNYYAGFSIGGNDNILLGNTARDNSIGMSIEFGSDNQVILNTFISNGIAHAEDRGFNTLFRGNYFDDHDCQDFNRDNICDSPFTIPGFPTDNLDLYPVTSPYFHALIPPQILYPNGREVLTSSVNVSWFQALDSRFHSISYSLYYSSNRGEDWTLIEENIFATNFTWAFASLPAGSEYLIKLIAECSEGFSVSDVSDNPFSITPTQPTSSRPSSFPGFLSIFGLLITFSILRFIRRKG